MLAVRVHEGGELRHETVADPVAPPGEVVVELRAAALNRRDLLVAGGTYPCPVPLIPGSDGAGLRRLGRFFEHALASGDRGLVGRGLVRCGLVGWWLVGHGWSLRGGAACAAAVSLDPMDPRGSDLNGPAPGAAAS